MWKSMDSSAHITAMRRKHNRLVLSVFSRELKFVEEEDETVPVNQIFLDGYICKASGVP